ncbi:hypothetical protein PFISCL1PPCAC_7064, partial [Pristionchus fissidentatus]
MQHYPYMYCILPEMSERFITTSYAMDDLVSAELGEDEVLDFVRIGEELVAKRNELLQDFGGLLGQDFLDLGRLGQRTTFALDNSDDLFYGLLGGGRELARDLIVLLEFLLELASQTLGSCGVCFLDFVALLLDDLLDFDALVQRVEGLVQNDVLDSLLSFRRHFCDPDVVLLISGCDQHDRCSSCSHQKSKGELHFDRMEG